MSKSQKPTTSDVRGRTAHTRLDGKPGEEEHLQRARAEEALMRHDLASRVRDHVYAGQIRSFLGTVEAYAAKNGAIHPDSGVAAWVKWARKVADGLDEMAIRTLLTYRPVPAERVRITLRKEQGRRP